MIQLFDFIMGEGTLDIIADSFVRFLAFYMTVSLEVRAPVVRLIMVVKARIFIVSI